MKITPFKSKDLEPWEYKLKRGCVHIAVITDGSDNEVIGIEQFRKKTRRDKFIREFNQ
jgi:hypothetical protein